MSAAALPLPPLSDDEDWAVARGYSKDGLAVTALDVNLLPHAGHLRLRWHKFGARMRALEVRARRRAPAALSQRPPFLLFARVH